MDFMSFKTDSCKAQLYVYLARISKEMHMNCDVSVCLILVSYVGTQEWCGGDVVALPPHIVMRCWAQHLRPDSMVWPDHPYCVWPCQACQKYSCTVWSIIGLRHLLLHPILVNSEDSWSSAPDTLRWSRCPRNCKILHSKPFKILELVSWWFPPIKKTVVELGGDVVHLHH